MDIISYLPEINQQPKSCLEVFLYTHYTLDTNAGEAISISQTIDYHTLTLEILSKTTQNLDIESLSKIAVLIEQLGIMIERPVDFSKITYFLKKITDQLFVYLQALFELSEVRQKKIY